MLDPSFRSLRHTGVFFFVFVILAGCGGARRDGGSKIVSGRGFELAVPSSWAMKRTPNAVSASDGRELVSVTVFPLARPYRPSLQRAAGREVDRAAAELAVGLGGHVAASYTPADLCPRCPGAGHIPSDILGRTYEIRYGDLVQEVTFVLVGRREYQLTCRRKPDGDAKPCERLRSSFRLT
jgi:hypothetical protein